MIRSNLVLRNYLINGGMEISQRLPSSAAQVMTASTTPTYLLFDRWRVSYSGTITGTCYNYSQDYFPAGVAVWDKENMLQCTPNASAVTYTWSQRIEAKEAKELVSVGYASFSALVKAENGSVVVNGNPTGASAKLILKTPLAADDYTSTATIYEEVLNVNLPQNTNATIKKDNLTIPFAAVNGLEVTIQMTFPVLSGYSIEGAINQVMLTPTKTALSTFIRSGSSYEEELRKCQRYCEVLCVGGIDLSFPVFRQSTTISILNHSFKVTKRTNNVAIARTAGATGDWFRVVMTDTTFSVQIVSCAYSSVVGVDQNAIAVAFSHASVAGTWLLSSFDTYNMSQYVNYYFDAEL